MSCAPLMEAMTVSPEIKQKDLLGQERILPLLITSPMNLKELSTNSDYDNYRL